MNFSTKTGLIISSHKEIIRKKKNVDMRSINVCAIIKKANLSLRPLGELYNPFAKNCSILCNHPTSTEMKSVLKNAKITAFDKPGNEADIFMNATHLKQKMFHDMPNNVPEEFLKRYTDTDSRPLTPTPTVISGRTKTSVGSYLNNRRCVTPEPVSNRTNIRKQLILDLRRSHSQETLYWNASSELSPAPTTAIQKPPSSIKPLDASNKIANLKKNVEKKKEEIVKPLIEGPKSSTTLVCINDRDMDEDDIIRRRGKKKRKSKSHIVKTVFYTSQDPETQVATLGPDSPNPSARPSIVLNDDHLNLMTNNDIVKNHISLLNNSNNYLDQDTLKLLSRSLDLKIVEGSFGRYMHRAFVEAYVYMTTEKLNTESDVVKNYKKSVRLPVTENDKWLKYPRQYTKVATRFELPIDTRQLLSLTPLQYLSQYVALTSYRKHLYHYIFAKYIPEPVSTTTATTVTTATLPIGMKPHDTPQPPNSAVTQPPINYDQAQETTRTIPVSVLDDALTDVLGFSATIDKIHDIQDLLEIKDYHESTINFRLWCGIVAFSERYLSYLSKQDDPPDEIEIADFESLERKLNDFTLSNGLKKILCIIKCKDMD